MDPPVNAADVACVLQDTLTALRPVRGKARTAHQQVMLEEPTPAETALVSLPSTAALLSALGFDATASDRHTHAWVLQSSTALPQQVQAACNILAAAAVRTSDTCFCIVALPRALHC